MNMDSTKNPASSQPKWTFDDVVKALDLVSVPTQWPVSGFAIDSRDVRPGQVFIALKGARTDGHDHLQEAFDRGAVLSLVERSDLPLLESHNFLRVPDTKAALDALGRFARERTNATIVAVSGSVGKTTVRSWIAQLLSPFSDVVSTTQNFNGQIGLPLSLTALGAETSFGVFEIGIDRPGTMAPLSNLCRPHVAVLTSVAAAHIENFSSLNELALEKARVCKGLEPGGILVVDHATLRAFPVIGEIARQRGAQDIVSVGFDQDATVHITHMVEHPGETSTHVEVDLAGVPVRYDLNLRGKAAVLDSALALTATLCAAYEGRFSEIVEAQKGILPQAFLSRMLGLKLPQGRGATTIIRSADGRKITVVDDAYNANPASMEAGLERLLATPGQRHIAILGDMLALGDKAEVAHRILFKTLAKKGAASLQTKNVKGTGEAEAITAERRPSRVDKVFVVGPECKKAYRFLDPRQKGGSAERPEELLPWLKEELRSGDVVWIKGSHDTGLHGFAETLRALFQDEVVEEAA